MFTASLLASALLCSVVSATPVVVNNAPITLSLSKRLNLTGTGNLLLHDQARAKSLLARVGIDTASNKISPSNLETQPLQNQAVTYVAAIGVGTPPTTYELILDSGSSNTWVGATKKYAKTSSSVATQDGVSVTYGSGSFSGIEFIDTVTITPELVIRGQSIGVANSSRGFDGVDGILGIGPTILTTGTLSGNPRGTVPTVTDNLFSQRTIGRNEIGIYFQPTNKAEVMNGEINWGGTDSSKFTGSINYAPVTSIKPATFYWGIQQSITYGPSTMIMPDIGGTAGIVDTGTTLLLIPTDAFYRYMQATGAVVDSQTGLLKISKAQYANLKSLLFHINGVTYELTANAQIWPRSLNTEIGGTDHSIYLVVADIGANSGTGLDFINGYVFLERFYSVYDTAQKRVGFATTKYTHANTN